jgi:hypothetical protein
VKILDRTDGKKEAKLRGKRSYPFGPTINASKRDTNRTKSADRSSNRRFSGPYLAQRFFQPGSAVGDPCLRMNPTSKKETATQRSVADFK